MIQDMRRYLNKTIFVSIPTLFDDGICKPYKLLGAELTGLWLQSEELTDRLLPDDAGYLRDLAPMVFVPFSHIAGVLVATGAPAAPTAEKANGDASTGMAGQAQEGKQKRGAKK